MSTKLFATFGSTKFPTTRTPKAHVLVIIISSFASTEMRVASFYKRTHVQYVDEMQDFLHLHCSLSVSVPTVLQTLVCIKHNLKSVSKHAIERDEVKRVVYWHKIGEIAPDDEMLVFLNKVARNEKIAGRPKGWLLRGTRCIQCRCFVRAKWYSVLPALRLDGIITQHVVEGSVTADCFYCFLRDLVVCLFFISFRPCISI